MSESNWGMPNRSIIVLVAGCVALATASPAFAGDGPWIQLTDETSTRLVADPAIGAADIEEKDYAWSDVDQDGDIDLICVRKEPFTTLGGRRNVLFMNEGVADGQPIDGVLVDRTAEFIADSDSSGQNDFLDMTNDRDVVLVDVDNDTWLDIVTATTLGDGLPKTISHPRIYMNLGEQDGVWQGFAYDEPRIPQIEPGTPEAAPRFCSVAAGDLTDDGFADLYFGDYDSGGAQILDYNNRLLINDGTGFFDDETAARLTSEMRNSAFGAASVIADMNGDGSPDVVKQTSLNAPQHVAVTYNSPVTPGTFTDYDVKYSLAPYFVSVDDLNGDGMLDIVVTDDDVDRYMLNTGNDASGLAQFSVHVLPEDSGFPDADFGGNSFIADLDRDCHLDVIIADVDVDISGCERFTNIYRNQGDAPNVTFANESAVIPDAQRTGVHDVAVFDLNNDGWLDLIMGRCDGMEIWMQTPRPGIVFEYPGGLPEVVQAGETHLIAVELVDVCEDPVDPSTAMLHYAVDGGAMSSVPLADLGDGNYEASLPAADCGAQVEYYVEASVMSGGVFTDPPAAPITMHVAEATNIEEILRDEIEGSVDQWTISSDGSLTSGEWEAAVPNGTISGAQLAAPEDDHTPAGVTAFVTENGLPGGAVGVADIDGGATYLLSPTIDLAAAAEAQVSYARWFFTTGPGEDFFRVEISDDNGGLWTVVDEVTSTIGGSETVWDVQTINVSDYVALTDSVRLRFTAADVGTGTLAEAGIDDFVVNTIGCNACPSDIAPDGDPDGQIDVIDLLAVLGAWGPCPAPCNQDTNGDEQIDVIDLLNVLGAWGPCP